MLGPKVLVAVSMYTVVTTGVTVVELFMPTICPSSSTYAAPVVLHESVADSPSTIAAGSATNVLIIGRLFTVTVVLLVAVPYWLDAVAVYVVVTIGDTL